MKACSIRCRDRFIISVWVCMTNRGTDHTDMINLSLQRIEPVEKVLFIMDVLESERLLLIPFSLDLKKLTLANKSKLAELLGVHVPEHWPQKDFAEALPFFIGQMEQDPTHATWDVITVHKADKVVIGGIGCHGAPDEAGMVEIGYDIIPEYQRHGYATEMAGRFITWLFQQPDIKVITAECLDDNIGSIRVLEKVGMKRVGHDGDMIKWELSA
ncbi:MAG TPA: GNAT family N-acetyltransferase [Ktedonobacter sp.]|nr:GNAT family N-acetyltransferase [Ktedonobacter sp.]